MRAQETPKEHEILGFLEIAVGDRNFVAEGGESLTKAQGHRHRPMTPSGATDPDTEITPLIALIERNQKSEQPLQMFEKLAGGRVSEYILLNPGILTGQCFQLRHKERISDKSDIEEKVDVIGHAKFISKRDQGNGHATNGSILAELPESADHAIHAR